MKNSVESPRTRDDEFAGATAEICPDCGTKWTFSNPMIYCLACGAEMPGAKFWHQDTGKRRKI